MESLQAGAVLTGLVLEVCAGLLSRSRTAHAADLRNGSPFLTAPDTVLASLA